MAQAKDREAYDVGEKIGELKGTQNAMLATLTSIQNELIRMAAEQDSRHKDSADQIAKRHQENVQLIAAHDRENKERHKENKEQMERHEAALESHKNDDNSNFKKIFRLWNIAAGVMLAISLLWTVFAWVVPLILKVKGIGN